MQNIFNDYHVPKVGISVDPNWRYIRSGLKRNISEAILYYRSKNFSVKNNHLLVSFLRSSSVSISGTIEDFYNHHQNNGVRSSTIFNMTSSLGRGTIFNGVFLGAGSKEIIIASDDYYNPVDLEANWEDIAAVTFLDHPKSDTSLLLANGKAYSTEEGTSVININVPALMVQYRCWLKQQKELVDLGHGAYSTSVFVHRYVLPNMLNSQLDVAIFNRLNNFINGAPIGIPKYRHAFVLVDYNDRIDKVLKAIAVKQSNKDRDFHTMMREIPLINKNNLLEFARLPENAPTRQLIWAEIVARIKYISFLIHTNPANGLKLNMGTINYIKKMFDQLENSKGLEQIEDKSIIRDLEAEIIRIRLTCKI